MTHEYATRLHDLAGDLTRDRVFAPRTPHTYSHLGLAAVALVEVSAAYPDLPETSNVYQLPLPLGDSAA